MDAYVLVLSIKKRYFTITHGRIKRGAAGAAPPIENFLLCLSIA